MIYIIWSSVRCFSANTGTKQKTPYTTLNTCKVFPGTIFKYLQGLTSSYTIYFNFFHYTVKSMLLSWLTHAHGYVHGYVRACSYMFMHVKFWLPKPPSLASLYHSLIVDDCGVFGEHEQVSRPTSTLPGPKH